MTNKSKRRVYANLHLESREVNKQLSSELFNNMVVLLLWYRGPIITVVPQRTCVVMRVAGEQMG